MILIFTYVLSYFKRKKEHRLSHTFAKYDLSWFDNDDKVLIGKERGCFCFVVLLFGVYIIGVWKQWFRSYHLVVMTLLGMDWMVFFFVTMFFGVLLVMLVGCCIPNMESTKQLYHSYKPVKQLLEEKIVEYSIEEKERKIKTKNNKKNRGFNSCHAQLAKIASSRLARSWQNP